MEENKRNGEGETNGERSTKISEKGSQINEHMANTVVLGSASSQSSLLLHLRPISKLSLSTRTPVPRFSCNFDYPTLAVSSKKISTLAGVVSSDSTSSAVIADTVDSTKGGIEIEPDIGGGGGDGSGSGGGGGGGGGGGEGEGEGEGESSDESGKKNKMGMSMSQKLTLGYAALVGGKFYFILFCLFMGSFLFVK